MTNVITDNEQEIREKFKFRKNKNKYPLVYKRKGIDGSIETILVDRVELVQLDSDGEIGSLMIYLVDGSEVRICSAYLKEMQFDKFSFDIAEPAEE